MFDQLMIQFLNGLSYTMILVLVGFGMAIVFGLMDVVNLAHGEFFMLGAYVAWITSQWTGNFWLSLMLAPLVLGLLGMLIERTLIRRFYTVPIVTLLLTWGLSIFFRQTVRLVVGPDWKKLLNPLPGATELLGIMYPTYRLFIIGLTVFVMAMVAYLILKTDFGLRCRAVIQNREMAAAMGVRTHRIDSWVFGLGTALAGLAGAVMAPLLTIQPEMGLPFLADSFMVVIVGGIGRILGVVAGGLTLGLGYSFVSFFADPIWSKVAIFAFAILMIRLRPQGLLGTMKRGSWVSSYTGDTSKARRWLPRLAGGHFRRLPVSSMAVLLVVLLIPLVASGFQVGFLAKYFVFAIFALSLGLMWGYAGILSFGHAGLFGLGAYAMGLLMRHLTIPGSTYVSLLAAIVVPAVLAALMGYFLFYGKVSGVFFSIVTMVMSLILYQVVVSSIQVTGGLNGLYPIPPLKLDLPGLAGWQATTPHTQYYAVLAILVLVFFLCRKTVASSFGRLMRAIEGNEGRTEYFGYNLANAKIAIFTLSAAIAGLAGGLYASTIGFVSPDLLGLVMSTEVIVWVAVGGRGTLIGPIVGAILMNVFALFLSGMLVTVWYLIIGVFLVIVVLFRPKGIMGYVP